MGQNGSLSRSALVYFRKRQIYTPWRISFFMRHSKKHEKTNSFLEEVNYYGAINS